MVGFDGGVDVEEKEKWVGVTVGLESWNKASLESWKVTTYLWALLGCFERVGRWVWLMNLEFGVKEV
mgnify:CR=1 FL=1